MLRSPLALAALADAAVPGLRPKTVREIPTHPGEQFQVAHITGADGREWVVRSALSAAAGAQMEQSEGLLRLLARRVPFEVPRIAGSTLAGNQTVVAVYPSITGHECRWRELEGGSPLARSIGHSLAALHDADPRIVDEAGLPTYDADAYRARRLATLDRAATTGLVPAALLGRWERALEEISLWRFATCVTHGPLEGRDVLVDDHETVVAVTGWEAAGVSDPAEDFAPLSVLADQDAFDTVLEAYAAARREAPDAHLERRIRLAAELQRVNALLDAITRDESDLVQRRAHALERLAEATHGKDDLIPPTGRRPAPTGEAIHTAPVNPAEIDVVEVHELDDDDDTVEIPRDAAPGAESASRRSGSHRVDPGKFDSDETSEQPVVVKTDEHAGHVDDEKA